jgi:ribosome-binding ATPase
MSIAAGLVGLPNVGKSTLFNALTKSSVPAENYPFCTIDPHRAITPVPDDRLDKLQQIYKSGKQIPATVQFVDIAGLVKGAASGEGLGNQFLSHIREVDLLLHIVRCFTDPSITSTRDEIDPLVDFDIISTELMLKDIEAVHKRREKLVQLMKKGGQPAAHVRQLETENTLLTDLEKALNDFDRKRVTNLIATSQITTIPLLSAKKFLVIANIAEHEIADNAYKKNEFYQKLVTTFGDDIVIPICAKLEYELSQLNDAEAQEMAAMFGLEQSGLDRIIHKTYQHLGLITFFTCGPQEIHAWPIRQGTAIRKAAGEIHSDLEKGFICAEVVTTKDLITYGSEAKAKEMGKMRTEGQDYIVSDGDSINVKFNV